MSIIYSGYDKHIRTLSTLAHHRKVRVTLAVVSHALFIPVFLLGTGFLVNTKIFVNTIIDHIDMVLLVVGGLIFSKFVCRLDRRKIL